MPATGRLITSIYGYNSQPLSRAGLSGVSNSFPSAQCIVYAAPAGTTANTVVIQSVIQLLPMGLNQKSNTYWSADTPATIQSSGT